MAPHSSLEQLQGAPRALTPLQKMCPCHTQLLLKDASETSHVRLDPFHLLSSLPTHVTCCCWARRAVKRMHNNFPSCRREAKRLLLKKQLHFFGLDHGTKDRHDLIGAGKVTPLVNTASLKHHVSHAPSRC